MLHTSVFIAYYPVQKSPSSAVSIRAIETVRYKVINKINDEVLEEIEESKAFFQVRTVLCL